MTEENETQQPTYLYVAVWEGASTPVAVVHRIALLPGVAEADFERFMVKEALPNALDVPTRAGWIVERHLLKEDTATGRMAGLDLDLGSFGTRTAVSEFAQLGRWVSP